MRKRFGQVLHYTAAYKCCITSANVARTTMALTSNNKTAYAHGRMIQFYSNERQSRLKIVSGKTTKFWYAAKRTQSEHICTTHSLPKAHVQ